MINKTRLVLAMSGALAIVSQSVFADDVNAGRSQSMQQATNQMHEQMYGSQLMTEQERLRYQEQMRNLKTNEEREAYRLEHHEQMKQRAKERGVELPDMPPAQGQGKGQGMGQGMGQGQGGGQSKGR